MLLAEEKDGEREGYAGSDRDRDQEEDLRIREKERP